MRLHAFTLYSLLIGTANVAPDSRATEAHLEKSLLDIKNIWLGIVMNEVGSLLGIK